MTIKRLSGGFGFGRALNKFNDFKIDAPKVIANNSKNWFLEGFRKGGFQTDASKTGWEKRQPRKKTIKRNAESPGLKKRKLILEGDLKRALKVLEQTWHKIEIGVLGEEIPYAERHNEGLKGMPKSEFVGDSKGLNESNKKLLAKLVGNIFR